MSSRVSVPLFLLTLPAMVWLAGWVLGDPSLSSVAGLAGAGLAAGCIAKVLGDRLSDFSAHGAGGIRKAWLAEAKVTVPRRLADAELAPHLRALRTQSMVRLAAQHPDSDPKELRRIGADLVELASKAHELADHLEAQAVRQ